MKIKSWQYSVVLYFVMVAVGMLHLAYQEFVAPEEVSYIWNHVLFIEIGKALGNLIIAYPISLMIDPLLRKVFDNTAWANLVLTVTLFRIIDIVVRHFVYVS